MSYRKVTKEYVVCDICGHTVIVDDKGYSDKGYSDKWKGIRSEDGFLDICPECLKRPILDLYGAIEKNHDANDE